MKPNRFTPYTPLKTTSWRRAPDPSARREQGRLLPEEEARVRLALEVLRAHYGQWKDVARELKSNKRTLTKLLCFERRITATYALRVARLIGEPLGEILSGAFQGRHECPTCGAVTMNGKATSQARRLR